MTENVLIAILGGGNLLLFVKFLIERYDKKQEKEDENQLGKINGELISLTGELKKLKKDGIRTQMLVLILLKPDEKKEILTLAEHYFKKLEGNWYMTSVFNGWLERTNTAKPEWFKGE